MVRPSDPFWGHVDKDTGSLKCKYCPFVYSPGSSISRVKAHLSGLKGRGVAICTNPPLDVKEAAHAEIEGTRERKKQKPGHTDVSDVTYLQQLGEGSSAAEPLEGNRFSECVERKEDGACYCSFCGHSFGVDSILGVKEHLSGIKGPGVLFCPSVPHDIMKAARAEIERTRERKGRKTDPVSITDASDVTDLHRDDGEYQVPDGLAVEPVSVSVQGMEQVAEEGDRSLVVVENIPQPPVRRNHFWNYLVMVDGRKCQCMFCGHQFAASTTRIIMHFSGQAGLGVKSCTHVSDNVKKRAIEHVQKKGDRSRTAAENIPQQVPRLVEQDVSFKMQMEDEDDTGRIGLLTEKFVGKAFDENLNKSLTSLRKDDVSCIGIFGMGGIGKTTLAMHIYNQLLENQDPPHRCYWVNVSLDSSIYKLQTLIARAIHLDLPSEVDESIRAAKLHRVLTQMHNTVLVLDDLWNWFDARLVGIPIGPNQCKLIITTRSLDICRQMCCQVKIRLSPLSQEEAWILFSQELGNYGTEVKELAKAVSRECDGLPLGIRVMARSMKGICSVHTWRNTLEELKESKVSKGHKMREEVFSVLKFSYLRLNDPALEECLSYCALYPEDEKIDRNELIENMIVEGIIDERKSRQAELDKGHTMLDTLENACLLEGDTRNVWMHDLIRDMVILELREESKTFVEAGAQLKELPDVKRWTEKLVRVSLMSNDIEVIPSSHTPRCPSLSTLLLCRNRGLKMIADSFFEQFQKLKVLDLSDCVWIEELPRSISDLVNLTALLLRGCRSLIHVPSLAKLEKLKQLDLSHCEWLKQMPKGVTLLLNLKYLDLSGSGIEKIGSGIIPMLSRLQVLKLCDKYEGSKFSIRGSEVGELRKLETLHCGFSNVREFGEYMKSRERSQQSPSDYSISITREYSRWLTISRELGSRKFVSVTGDGFIDPLALPTDIEGLQIDHCYSTLYKRLFPPSLLASLLNLQEICVNNWQAIEEIFAKNEGENGEWGFPFSNYSTHSLSNQSLLNLKLIDIRECNKLKKLFPPCLLLNLHNLQKISVGFCNGMEEIFSTDQEEEDGQELLFDQPNLTGLHLSRLTTLKLRYLPELRSIYKSAIICNSLQQIELLNCPKLKRITFPLPQPSLQIIQVYPRELWESLQWGKANDKNDLESLCVFKGQFE